MFMDMYVLGCPSRTRRRGRYMYIDMYIDIYIDMCSDVWIDMCFDVCLDMYIVKRSYNLSSVQDQGNRFIIVRSVSRLGYAGEGHI